MQATHDKTLIDKTADILNSAEGSAHCYVNMLAVLADLDLCCLSVLH